MATAPMLWNKASRPAVGGRIKDRRDAAPAVVVVAAAMMRTGVAGTALRWVRPTIARAYWPANNRSPKPNARWNLAYVVAGSQSAN
ncbi:hypothetical protein, partial [Rhodopirellula islandica]|uniref:hypothetical protein n=1 Tax=Rhodopirellula islandica TaxID=595434 RepID=UPI00064B3886